MQESFGIFLQYLTLAVVWLVVPLIMIGMAIMAGSMPNRVSDPDIASAARAGRWAGLLAFVIYFVRELPAFKAPSTAFDQDLQVSLWLVGGGAVVGFFGIWLMARLLTTRALGFFVLVVVFAGLSTLHSYFFLRTNNDMLMAVTLGIVFGAFIHQIIDPQALRSAIPPTRPSGPRSDTSESSGRETAGEVGDRPVTAD